MSKEALDQFVKKIAKSDELTNAIGAGVDAESLITLGAEHGFEFSIEDLREAGWSRIGIQDGDLGLFWRAVQDSMRDVHSVSYTHLTLPTKA